jgi:hypothetical protein
MTTEGVKELLVKMFIKMLEYAPAVGILLFILIHQQAQIDKLQEMCYRAIQLLP